MSPSRRHYGPRPPGTLEATMLKVLAAELSDARRLGRGKEIFAADDVIELNIESGRVDAAVAGSRVDPYQVMLATRPGTGVPSAAELAASCSCPDAERVRMCKHAVATVFALASEVAVEPELLTRWRGGDVAASTSTTHDKSDDGLAPVVPLFDRDPSPSSPAPDDDGDSGDDGDSSDDSGEWEPDETVAQINSMLLPPSSLSGMGTQSIPDLGPVVPIRQRPSGDPMIDRMLAEIFDEFDLGW